MIKYLLSFISEMLFSQKDDKEPETDKTGKPKKKTPIKANAVSTRRKIIVGALFAASVYGNYLLVGKLSSATVQLVELRADVREKNAWEQRAIAYQAANTDLLTIMKQYLTCEAKTIQNFEDSSKKIEKLHEVTKGVLNQQKKLDKNK